MSLHAVTLMIHQRLSLDVERYADQVDLRVVPPLCPISVAPTDFSQADDLIRRAYQHTADWLSSPTAGRPGPTSRCTASIRTRPVPPRSEHLAGHRAEQLCQQPDNRRSR